MLVLSLLRITKVHVPHCKLDRMRERQSHSIDHKLTQNYEVHLLTTPFATSSILARYQHSSSEKIAAQRSPGLKNTGVRRSCSISCNFSTIVSNSGEVGSWAQNDPSGDSSVVIESSSVESSVSHMRIRNERNA